MIKITFFTIALFTLTGWNTLVNAQCTLDQNQPLTNGGTSERNLPGYYDGQTFTAGATGELCEVDIMMFNTMSGTGILNIYSGSGVSGTLLATQGVNVNVPTGQVWQNWTIASPPLVTQNAVYTFQFIPIQGGGLPDPYGVNVYGADVYPGGYDITFTGFDLTFRTYVDMSTGVNDVPEGNNFRIYPNPTAGKFVIDAGRNIDAIKIYNCIGENVHSAIIKQQAPVEIDISVFPKGIYVVHIYSGETVRREKLVVE
ncbi:MAG: T9SS type A sorting domain-containing protein [Bacteroidetes bacterium]|nr:T9SS type A sorting domain-containing protein [Bacteroidota bacterium]